MVVVRFYVRRVKLCEFGLDVLGTDSVRSFLILIVMVIIFSI